jgi:toxin-antitoxin system PIN domain toxin
MIGIDTNILIYARVATSPFHAQAVSFLESLGAGSQVVIAEMVLVELYLALRNPAILAPPLDAPAAAAECQFLRAHPHWALAEYADVMEAVWRDAAMGGFARRRIIDVRLARTLIAHGVTDFATANERDFQNLGFARVWNPLVS